MGFSRTFASGLGGGGGGSLSIKSIQYVSGHIAGSVNLANLALSTTVNTLYTVLVGMTSHGVNGDTDDIFAVTYALNNPGGMADIVQLSRKTSATLSLSCEVGIYVVEFQPTAIKSLQVGSLTTSTGIGTASITAVDTSKSIIIPGGYKPATAGIDYQLGIIWTFNSATQIQGQVFDALTEYDANYQVLEFN